MNKSSKTKKLAMCALIAAVYTVLCIALAPISYNGIQVRVSEAMTVLPFLVPYTSFGLFVGCVLANLFSPFGINMLDIIFGSLATLLAAWLTSKMPNKWLAPIPPVIVNAAVIGAVLAYTSSPGAFWQGYALFAFQVGLGQLAACYIGGMLFLWIGDRINFKKYF